MLLVIVCRHPLMALLIAACLRWLLSHQGLKHDGAAQTVTISAQAHWQHAPKDVCVKALPPVLVSVCLCPKCVHFHLLMFIIPFSHHNYLHNHLSVLSF